VPLRDVVHRHGHRRIVELLARSVSRAALPPSLIFAGPAESGTRATATALAQLLNCVHAGEPDISDACGQCQACVKIARGVHPDVLVVEPGENGTIKIDQIREVVDRSAFRPFEGRRRVVLVDEADAMVAAAQNALLKTLEEPPSSSIFVLVTSRPDVLLPTVRSRCIRLVFTGQGTSEVDSDVLDVATRVLTHAASSNDGARLEGAKALLEGTGNNPALDRVTVSTRLRAAATMVRDMAAMDTRAEAALVNDGRKEDLERLATSYRGRRSVAAYEAIDDALEAIERNGGIKVVADWLVLQL
jgi:DNA polymerase-3 subunit delta'